MEPILDLAPERGHGGAAEPGSLASVVIPAYNEGAVIQRCLDALLEGTAPGELEVTVVCNGCSDDTAEKARAFTDRVRVIETPVASKTHALNLGDEASSVFPRIYLDADVILDATAARALAQVLRTGEVLAAAPRMAIDLSRSSWGVRAYYVIWNRTGYASAGHIGSGVFALAEDGRRRFGAFPDIIADDHFVYSQFRHPERETVAGASFTIFAARDLRSLVRRKVRVIAGLQQLRTRFPDLPGTATEQAGGLPWQGVLRQHPALLRYAPVYVAVTVLARSRAWWRLRWGNWRAWNRDEGSRLPT